MSGLVRRSKQSEAAKVTHNLERSDVGTGQVIETKRGSKGNSLAGEGRRRDWSGHENKARQQGELTGWRGRTSGLVRTWRQSKTARGTHSLERTDIEIGQDMHRNWACKENSQSGAGRRWGRSSYKWTVIQRGALTSWKGCRFGLVWTPKETQ